MSLFQLNKICQIHICLHFEVISIFYQSRANFRKRENQCTSMWIRLSIISVDTYLRSAWNFYLHCLCWKLRYEVVRYRRYICTKLQGVALHKMLVFIVTARWEPRIWQYAMCSTPLPHRRCWVLGTRTVALGFAWSFCFYKLCFALPMWIQNISNFIVSYMPLNLS